MNPRLRTAIQAAKQANMPKDNISRAISKSEISNEKNFDNLRYEGFGPFNIAFIIETLTDNKIDLPLVFVQCYKMVVEWQRQVPLSICLIALEFFILRTTKSVRKKSLSSQLIQS